MPAPARTDPADTQQQGTPDDALTAAVAAALAAGSVTAAFAALVPLLAFLRLPRSSVAWLVVLAWRPPAEPTTDVMAVVRAFRESTAGASRIAPLGPAGRRAQEDAVLYRAAYAVNAARRVAGARAAAEARATTPTVTGPRGVGADSPDAGVASTPGPSVAEQIEAAEARARAAEERFAAQQQAAEDNRAAAAATVDVTAMAYGPLLGWYAAMDSRTSAECRAANGGVFSSEDPPVIGWPGAVHPNCRCRPGPPTAGSVPVNTQLRKAGLLGRRPTATTRATTSR